jgi:hypothetical protein
MLVKMRMVLISLLMVWKDLIKHFLIFVVKFALQFRLLIPATPSDFLILQAGENEICVSCLCLQHLPLLIFVYISCHITRKAVCVQWVWLHRNYQFVLVSWFVGVAISCIYSIDKCEYSSVTYESFQTIKKLVS